MKSYTDIEQSKKLAEILPIESADMVYLWHSTSDNPTWRYSEDIPPMVLGNVPINELTCDALPCWSLAALLGVLPSSIKDSIGMVYSLNMNKEYIEYSNPNISSLYSAYIHTCGNDNLVDACYEMIIGLHGLNLL